MIPRGSSSHPGTPGAWSDLADTRTLTGSFSGGWPGSHFWLRVACRSIGPCLMLVPCCSWPDRTPQLSTEQLAHLKARMSLPTVSVRIIPSSVGRTAAAVVPFIIYDFLSGSPSVAFVDRARRPSHLRDAAADLNVHPRVVQQILRHAQIAITMEIYTEVTDEATRDALRRLGESLDD